MHSRIRPGAAAIAVLLLAPGCNWIVRASVDGAGTAGNSTSGAPSLSGDGRYVAFESFASNLVDGDTNGVRDIFVRDNASGAVQRVSADTGGVEANAQSSEPDISDDGRFVAFASFATNLVTGDTDGGQDVFVHDRQTGVTTRVSDNGAAPARQPDLSATGRYLAYESGILNPQFLQFPSVFRYDQETASTEAVFGGFTGGDNNGALAPSISDEGRFVAFSSTRPGGGPTGFLIRDVLVRDMTAGTTVLALGGDAPAISGDGRLVAYHREPPGEIANVYLTDRITGATRQASVDSTGTPGNASSVGASISDDGRYVAYSSIASNLIAGDGNGTTDVFVHDLLVARTTLVSRSADRVIGNGASDSARIAGLGRYVAFASSASNLVGDDTNGAADVFVRAYPQPRVSSAAPSNLPRGATSLVTITGVDFRAPLTVTVAGGGISTGSVTLLSETQLTVSLTVDATAALGPRFVTVTNAGSGIGTEAGASGTCRCVTIAEA